MTRDQAQKIANDIFDAAESAGHLSKDLVADAIFNSWHKQTADNRKWASTLGPMTATAVMASPDPSRYLVFVSDNT